MALHRAPFCIVEMAVLIPASLTVPSRDIRKCLALTLLLSRYHIILVMDRYKYTDVYIPASEGNVVPLTHLAAQVI